MEHYPRDPTNDGLMHLLARQFAQHLLGLATGGRITGELEPLNVKFPAEILIADYLWRHGHELFHWEFESELDRKTMGRRLLSYRARIREHKDLQDLCIRHTVLVLGGGTPTGFDWRRRKPVIKVTYNDPDYLALGYHVILVRNIPTETLLAHPVTAALAPLGWIRRPRRGARLQIVRRALQIIRDATGIDNESRFLLYQALRGFAGFRVEQSDMVKVIFEEELPMGINWRESSTIGPLILEGEARGRAEGIIEGEARGEAIGRILGMLEFQYGPDPRISGDLALELMDTPNIEHRIRNTTSLDQLIKETGHTR